MKLLDDYLQLEKEIHAYFGYEEGWCVFPIDDCRKYFWAVFEHNICFAEKEVDVLNYTGDIYSHEIYQNGFLPKSVFKGQDFTMIVVDTHTDGNKFLCIFDNIKETVVIDREDDDD